MKSRIVIALVMIGMLTLACAGTAPTQQAGTVETMVAATLQALSPVVPTEAPATEIPTQAPPVGVPVSFENVSFVIPQGLALGANGEAVPLATEENTAPWEVAPAHVHFEFYGYNNVLAKFSGMEITIFPAQEYAAVNFGAAANLPRLQAILAAPTSPIDVTKLPEIPYYNAAQMFAAQVEVIDFVSGTGVRMVTQYGQAVGPVSNNGTLYHFQGLTSDGKYYIVAVLPIGAPYLLNPTSQYNTDDPNVGLPEGGVPFPGYTSIDPKDYESYFQAVADKMNSTDPNSFSPALPLLDALVQSITITNP